MPGDLTDQIIAVIAETQRLPVEKITLESRFEDLGLDSMDAVNILFSLEEKFDISIPDEAARQIRTIGEMVEGVKTLVEAKGDAAAQGESTESAAQ